MTKYNTPIELAAPSNDIFYNNEFMLLVACSWNFRLNLSNLQSHNIGMLFKKHINWNFFVKLVDRHRVPTLAYNALTQYGHGGIPDCIMKQLKERSNQSRIQALKHGAELINISKAFANQEISLMPLKGITLSQHLYNDIGVRHTRDIDILIKAENMLIAHEILVENGYRRQPSGFDYTNKQHDRIIKYLHHFEYVNSRKNILVELHWRFHSWPQSHMNTVWENSIPSSFNGVPVYKMSDCMLLLMLCDHGAMHAWFRLKWLSDIAMLLTKERLEGGENLFELAERLDLTKTLAQTTHLVQNLYKIPLSDSFLNIIRQEKNIVSLCKPAIKALQKTEMEVLSSGSRVEGLLASIQMYQRRKSLSWHMILMTFLTSKCDYYKFRLPDKWFWLYIPLRPVFWVLRHFIK